MRRVLITLWVLSLSACGPAYMGPSKTSTYLVQNNSGRSETITVQESKPSAYSNTTNVLITNSSGKSSFYTIQGSK